MKFGNNIDLQKYQLVRAAIEPSGTAPAAPVVGQTYFDTGTNRLLNWTGAAWVSLATDSALLNGQNAAFYLNRNNHTGTQTAATISDLATTVQGYRLDQFAVPTADLNLNSRKITSLADPTAAQDAATKNYVDTQVQTAAAGIDSKPSVRVVATTSITLSGLQTVDGISVTAGQRVLAVGQTTASQNGVYVAAAGAWTRATDADQNGEVTPGATWFVEEGTSFGASTWRVATTGTIVVGTTNISITQLTAGINYTASLGVQLVGNDIRAQVVAGGGIQAVAGGLQVDTSVVARKFSATVGNGALLNVPVTHNLGTKDVSVTVREVANDQMFFVDWDSTDNNTVTLKFGAAPALNSVRVTVIG